MELNDLCQCMINDAKQAANAGIVGIDIFLYGLDEGLDLESEVGEVNGRRVD